MDDPSGGMFMFHYPSSFFDENPTLDPLTGLENYLHFPDHQQPCHDLIISSNILDPDIRDDPVSTDHFVWDLCNDVVLEQGCDFGDTVFEDTNQILPPRPQYNCAFCQILRDVTHTNGSIVKRLEIHGKFGVITHAHLGIYGFDPASQQGEDIQMIDFGNESTQMVKKFMVQYFEACKQEGYDLLQDPLSNFYDALCVGLNDSDDQVEFIQFSPENTGECPNSELKNPEGGRNQMGFTKIPLAMQRERTRNLRLKDFVEYSDLPIEDAARRMNICPTVMKKICRKNGVARWPYRKIKSIRRKISKKTRILDASDEQERARALEDIQQHQQELARIYEVFNK